MSITTILLILLLATPACALTCQQAEVLQSGVNEQAVFLQLHCLDPDPAFTTVTVAPADFGYRYAAAAEMAIWLERTVEVEIEGGVLNTILLGKE